MEGQGEGVGRRESLPIVDSKEVFNLFSFLPSLVKERIQSLDNFLKERSAFIKTISNIPDPNSLLKEWGAAEILSQLAPNLQSFKDEFKPRFKNIKDLIDVGCDPARIARFLILQLTYPKRQSLTNENLTFTLDKGDKISQALNTLKIIPGYGNLDEEGLRGMLKGLGFKDNPAGGNWILPLNQSGWQELIRTIAYTSSAYQPRSR